MRLFIYSRVDKVDDLYVKIDMYISYINIFIQYVCMIGFHQTLSSNYNSREFHGLYGDQMTILTSYNTWICYMDRRYISLKYHHGFHEQYETKRINVVLLKFIWIFIIEKKNYKLNIIATCTWQLHIPICFVFYFYILTRNVTQKKK